MVYNKYKHGFLDNLLAYIVMLLFFIVSVLSIILAESPGYIVLTVVFFCLLMLAFIYDLFFTEVFIFKENGFYTNMRSNNRNYIPKYFKKVAVPYNIIIKIERRILHKKSYALQLSIENDEPIVYFFEKEKVRDFVYDKLIEITKLERQEDRYY